MTKQRSRHRHRRPRGSQSRYDPTPWPGLVGGPFVLLFNLVVTSAEDNAKTDGQIPLEPVETVQALDLSKQLGVLVHPAFVPAAKMPEVSRGGLPKS